MYFKLIDDIRNEADSRDGTAVRNVETEIDNA